jgi:hypothetical protein
MGLLLVPSHRYPVQRCMLRKVSVGAGRISSARSVRFALSSAV